MAARAAAGTAPATEAREDGLCCWRYHRAIELIGKRWTGAILLVLLEHGPMRFSEVGHAIPALSDRLLSERMKELEAEGIVARQVSDDSPVRVEYDLTPKGRALEPAVRALKSWARTHIG
jgi:DNA-binding HxlR family transcriptional regulator